VTAWIGPAKSGPIPSVCTPGIPAGGGKYPVGVDGTKYASMATASSGRRDGKEPGDTIATPGTHGAGAQAVCVQGGCEEGRWSYRPAGGGRGRRRGRSRRDRVALEAVVFTEAGAVLAKTSGRSTASASAHGRLPQHCSSRCRPRQPCRGSSIWKASVSIIEALVLVAIRYSHAGRYRPPAAASFVAKSVRPLSLMRHSFTK
jgi:hypothetical protein